MEEKNKLTIEQIREKAEGLAREYNPSNLSPFPFENIIQSHANLQISYAELPEAVSGVIRFNNELKKYQIFINKAEHQVRQHFTVAHELGHFFLHEKEILSERIIIDHITDNAYTLYRLTKTKQNQIEKEANNFAASLIMPSELVKSVWRELHSVEECADIFKVSTVAMSIRLDKLGLLNNE